MFRRDFVAHIVGAVVAWLSGIFGAPQKKIVRTGELNPADCGWGESLPAYPKPGLWLARFGEMGKRIWTCHADAVDGSAVQELHGMRLIRWIPVTERLPEYDRAWRNGEYVLSRDVLVVTGAGYAVMGHRFKTSSGEDTWAALGAEWVRHEISHWADLPSVPSEIAAKYEVPDFKNFTARYTTIDKEKLTEQMRQALLQLEKQLPRS